VKAHKEAECSIDRRCANRKVPFLAVCGRAVPNMTTFHHSH